MNFLKKWYTYQKERFPIVIYGLYALGIAFAVFCFCNYLGKNDYNEMIRTSTFSVPLAPYKIDYFQLIPMFVVAFLNLLMIRIKVFL